MATTAGRVLAMTSLTLAWRSLSESARVREGKERTPARMAAEPRVRGTDAIFIGKEVGLGLTFKGALQRGRFIYAVFVNCHPRENGVTTSAPNQPDFAKRMPRESDCIRGEGWNHPGGWGTGRCRRQNPMKVMKLNST